MKFSHSGDSEADTEKITNLLVGFLLFLSLAIVGTAAEKKMVDKVEFYA